MWPAQVVTLILWAFDVIPAIYGLMPATLVGFWVLWMVVKYFLSELQSYLESRPEKR